MNEAQPMLIQILQDADQFPFAVEQVAIDVTNGLRAAEVGLRSFRARPLLRRLWEGVAAQEQERLAAIGSDLVTVQRATVNLVQEIMTETARTQYCVERVLHNLHAVNYDLDDLTKRAAQLEGFFAREQANLRKEFYEEIKQKSQYLENVINHVRLQLEREATVRRLRDLFLADSLYPGVSEILKGALYLAQVARLFASETPHVQRQEWNAALAVLKQKMNTPAEYVPDLFLHSVTQIQPEALETTAYLTPPGHGPMLQVFNALIERRIAQVKVDEQVSADTIEVAKHLHDPESLLATRLLRPYELAARAATELLNIPPREE